MIDTILLFLLRWRISIYYGVRCNSYERHCGCCQAWRVYDEVQELLMIVD